ncbi:hypothetical protein RBH29_13510 [Herbivorax sp. ANBcel31]|uniref:hypothetical protein n=1 Tax=Herbivorax sp. ANBcel31 TaxID=3069754 RepID=UPI0027AEFAB1|nr:hypothetical protein [Herbivorax sp. ANBcel31]MDQ2087444.1 hypothetical protein [Herbivorax sp. ANBcel31]
MNSKKIWLTIIILSIYILLTFIKLFVGIVRPMGGTTDYLVIKRYPTIKNEWTLGEDTQANREKHMGRWYYEGKYTIIAQGELSVIGDRAVPFLAKIWWITTFSFVLVILFSVFMFSKK